MPIGGKLRFTVRLESESLRPQQLVVDYVVHFVKADGTQRPKLFKLKRLEHPAAYERAAAYAHAQTATRD